MDGVREWCIQRLGCGNRHHGYVTGGGKVGAFLKVGFRASNNEAEYEALNARLKAALKLEAADLKIYLDSRLVVNQVDGSFEARDSEWLNISGWWVN